MTATIETPPTAKRERALTKHEIPDLREARDKLTTKLAKLHERMQSIVDEQGRMDRRVNERIFGYAEDDRRRLAAQIDPLEKELESVDRQLHEAKVELSALAGGASSPIAFNPPHGAVERVFQAAADFWCSRRDGGGKIFIPKGKVICCALKPETSPDIKNWNGVEPPRRVPTGEMVVCDSDCDVHVGVLTASINARRLVPVG